MATCASPNCGKVTDQTLACPKCFELFSRRVYFCGQDCFRQNYKTHKKLHVIQRSPVSCAPTEPAQVRTSLPDWAQGYDFSGDLRPALYSPTPRPVKAGIRKPDYAAHPLGVSDSEQRDRASHNNIRVYKQEQLLEPDNPMGLRHACAMGREVLDIAGKALKVGVTTDEIDRIVHDACMERDVYPSPLNYYKFPKVRVGLFLYILCA